jgi:hypothetical protein
MRLHVILLLASLAGILLGGWLIGRWALGTAIALDSAAVGAWALFHDDGTVPAEWEPQVHGVPTLTQVLERARDAA